jgi:hypothetical protein
MGQPYCRGTTYEEDWARAAADNGRSLPEVWEAVTATHATVVDDLDGAPVRTAPHLLAFRNWIVRAVEALGTAAPGAPAVPRVVNATGAGILRGPGIEIAPLSAVLRTCRPARSTRRSIREGATELSRAAVLPADGHLLRLAESRGSSFPTTVDLAPTRTPFLQRPRRERIAATTGLRATRTTDLDRWSATENLDRAWERRVLAAADLIPPGSSVLDLGAGRQALRRHRPAGTTYTPADLFARSPDTVVVDVNAGEFPRGAFEVVVMLGLLEHVHDVRGLLHTAAEQTSTLVVSYCAMTAWHREVRLEKGWFNDFRLSDLVDLFGETGWDVAWAGRLARLTHFDQWIFACRSGRRLR